MSALSLVLRVAARSLGRNRRRTLITGAGIAVGVGMCIATFGLVDGLDGDIVRGVTDAELGHVQVHAPDYLTARSLQKTIHDAPAVEAAIGRDPAVVAAAPRAYAWGLATHGDQSVGVQIVGVDPPRERRVTTLASKLVAGAFVPDAPTPWAEGRALTPDERKADDAITAREREAALAELEALGAPGSPQGASGATSGSPDRLRDETAGLVKQMAPPPAAPPSVVLGAKLAEKLHVGVGDDLSVMAQDARGGPVDVPLHVVGVFRTGTDAIDRTRVLANLADVQRLAQLGSDVHEIALRVVEPNDAQAVASRLHALPPLAALDVQPWQRLRPDVLAMVAADEALMNTLLAIVFLIAGLGVANTMLMAIFERKRELGVLKALGMKPASIVAMIVVETLLLGALACAAGGSIGLGLDGLLAHYGWNVAALGRFSLAGVGLDPTLHAEITERGVALPVVAILAMALLGSLYPAISAARVEPAVGMRDVT